MKSKPNKRNTIRNATGNSVTPNKGIIKAAKIKDTIPNTKKTMSNRKEPLSLNIGSTLNA